MKTTRWQVGKKGTDSTYWGHDESRSGNDLDDQRSVKRIGLDSSTTDVVWDETYLS